MSRSSAARANAVAALAAGSRWAESTRSTPALRSAFRSTRAVIAVQGPQARSMLAAVMPEAATVGRFRCIDVDFDGTIGWNGEIIPDRNTLEARLASVAAIPDQPEVHLRPNKLVTYKVVAMIMASAQRLGVIKIGIVGNEQFL
mgnify:CR=1 FL=1